MKLNIEYLPTTELKTYANNAKIHTAEQIEQIKRSIQEFGFNDPIAVWKDNEIIEGHGRLIAALELGIEDLPIIRLDNLTDEQRRAYMLVHNKLTMNTDFDADILNMELSDLTDFDAEFYDFGITLDEEEEKEIVEVDIPEEAKPRCQEGDIWKIGQHRLICGDSTDEKSVDRLMNGEKAKLLFTSPPYNMNGGMYANYSDNMKSEEYIKFNLNVFNKWKGHTDYVMWNISYNKNARWEFIEIIHKLVKETGYSFLELIVWDKGHGMPIVSKEMLTRQYEDILLLGDENAINRDLELFYVGTSQKRAWFNKKKGKGITNFWKIGTNDTQLKDHAACFPVALPAEAIKLMSDKGDIIIDCFGGSGSTLIACEQLNRRCYMAELDPHYCDVIIQRWENYTGKKAEKVNG